MPVDFKTNQLKVNQIINSGSSAGKPLLIYGLGSSTDNSGGFNATHFATGSDTWLFISGTVGSRNSANRGAVAFGGDVIVSGALYDSSGVAYSTSAGVSYFSSTTTGSIFTTGSAAFVKNEAIDSPLDKGSNVFFYVSGSDAGVGTSLFGGPVISSGSFKTKNASGDVVATMDSTGLISGSGLQSASGLTIAGDAAINGGDITSTSTTFNLLNTGVTTALNIGGAAATTTIGSSSGLVVIPGDLYVAGTTSTIDVTNLTIEDPLLGVGFTTGSISISAGDRGFIGGQPSPSNNIAFGWSQNSGSFIATKTTSAPGATSFVVSDLQPIRAAKFQVSGTTAEIKGNGTSLQLSGTQIDAFASNDGMTFIIDGVTYGQISAAPGLFLGSSAIRYSASTTGFSTAISGADIYLNSDIGRTYFGQAPGGTPNTGLLLTVNPGAAGGLGGSVVFTAKQNETSAPALPMTMSGSQIIFSATDATTGKGFAFQDNGTSVVSINKDGSEVKIIASQLNGLTVGGGGSLAVSGTQINLKSGQNGFGFERDGSSFFSIVSGSKDGLSGNVTKLQMGSGKDALVSVDVSKTIFLSGTNTRIGSDTITLGVSNFSSAVVNVSASMNVSGSILPSAGGDLAFNLGSPTLRWAHVYTGDLHLRNERGDWTVIEENDFLRIVNNKTGKNYKMMMQLIED